MKKSLLKPPSDLTIKAGNQSLPKKASWMIRLTALVFDLMMASAIILLITQKEFAVWSAADKSIQSQEKRLRKQLQAEPFFKNQPAVDPGLSRTQKSHQSQVQNFDQDRAAIQAQETLFLDQKQAIEIEQQYIDQEFRKLERRAVLDPLSEDAEKIGQEMEKLQAQEDALVLKRKGVLHALRDLSAEAGRLRAKQTELGREADEPLQTPITVDEWLTSDREIPDAMPFGIEIIRFRSLSEKHRNQEALLKAQFCFAFLLVCFFYFILLPGFYGRTFGSAVFGLRTRQIDGKKRTVVEAAAAELFNSEGSPFSTEVIYKRKKSS